MTFTDILANKNKEIEKKIPSVIGIACIASNGVIGNSADYSIPWRKTKEDRELYKWDMEFFKRETEFNPVIMGFKTMYSMKKPLINRYNIVINKHKNDPLIIPSEIQVIQYNNEKIDPFEFIEIYDKDKNKFVMVNSMEDALSLVINMNNNFKYDLEKAFIIGGAKTYEEAFKKKYLSNLFITSLDESFEGDIYFPNKYIKEFSEYSMLDYNNGDIRFYENIDPEYKFKLIENIAKENLINLKRSINIM